MVQMHRTAHFYDEDLKHIEVKILSDGEVIVSTGKDESAIFEMYFQKPTQMLVFFLKGLNAMNSLLDERKKAQEAEKPRESDSNEPKKR
jgi:hypothetical protein